MAQKEEGTTIVLTREDLRIDSEHKPDKDIERHDFRPDVLSKKDFMKASIVSFHGPEESFDIKNRFSYQGSLPVLEQGDDVIIDRGSITENHVKVVSQTPMKLYTTVKTEEGEFWDVMTNRLTKNE